MDNEQEPMTVGRLRELLSPFKTEAPIAVRMTLGNGKVFEAEAYQVMIDGPRLVIDA